jgi:glutathione S-transferase
MPATQGMHMLSIWGRKTSSNVQALMWCVGHVLYRYYDIPIERPDHPALRAYYARLTGRAAYREHVMVSYDELQVR